ncbi:hypothetical protein [Desulfopila sp. IMCC35008]|uniref:alginate O-acetyltransferase AlgX-related protein n=1 Tax=Desulfopila sp. IMCC35008 TaxID=2653858 RepID=UPI0013D73A4A|nr:hypothetical protein [Desulfopila sp. IMCC35008]
MKQSTLFSMVLVAVFITFLMMPGIMMLYQPPKEISAVEKRKLAQFPTVGKSLDSIEQFPDEFETYFNDHFGLRDFYISIYNSTFTKLFRTSPNKNVILGREGWLYMAASGVLSDFLGQRITNESTIIDYVEELVDRQQWFNDRGVRYLFVPVPNKIQVYPEYLPAIYAGLAGETVYEKLFNRLGSRVDAAESLSLLPLFLEAKEQQQLYYKTDTHWNFTGAYLGYRHIINAIQQWFPDRESLLKKDLTSFKHTYPGDLAQLLHLEKEFAEQADDVRIRKECTGSGPRPIEWPEAGSDYKKSANSRKVYLAECHDKDLTVFIIQDSFGNHPSRFFANQFGKTYFFTKSDFRDIVPFIKEQNPDLVIDLHAARNLPKTLKPHPDVTAYVSQKRFNESRTYLIGLSGSDFSDNNLISHNIEIARGRPPGSFTATTNDPQFDISLPGGSGTHQGIVMHLEIDSPGDTLLQIFYNDHDQSSFHESRSVATLLKKGKNSLYLRLPAFQAINRIRLDPGKVKGAYTIHSFSVRKS